MVIAYSTPLFLAAVIPLLVLYHFIQRYYGIFFSKTGNQKKRGKEIKEK